MKYMFIKQTFHFDIVIIVALITLVVNIAAGLILDEYNKRHQDSDPDFSIKIMSRMFFISVAVWAGVLIYTIMKMRHGI